MNRIDILQKRSTPMGNRWERIKAMFSKGARERLDEKNLLAAEEHLYERSQRESHVGEDPEVRAERYAIERADDLREREGIARAQRADYDPFADAAKRGSNRSQDRGGPER